MRSIGSCVSPRFSFICVVASSLSLAACSEAPSGERTTETKREISVGGIFSASEETRTSEPVQPEEKPEQPQPRAGNLTAGDYDDLLNPELYAAYASRALQRQRAELPFVDTRTRVAVKVVDADGKPVPQASISVSRKGSALQLVSAADGVASFYPHFDDVGDRAQISASSAAGSVSRTLKLGAGQQTTILSLQGHAAPVQAMDLVLVLDTTGSMGDEMDYLQAELDSIVTRLKREAGNLDLRVGLIVYRDEGDDYVSRSFPLTQDVRSMRATLSEQSANGGGDMPEAVDKALLAAEKMQWRSGAAKALLLVADAPPHSNALGPTMDATRRLRSRGVQIVAVAASGVEDSAQYVMRTMAVLTQGRYIFLTNDSGIGNAHEELDVACYVVTRLDQLIARVLAGIVEGRRVEPEPAEIIRTVGDYDRGRCRGTEIALR